MTNEWTGPKDAERLLEATMGLALAKVVIAKRGDFPVPGADDGSVTMASELIEKAERDRTSGADGAALYLAAADRIMAAVSDLMERGA